MAPYTYVGLLAWFGAVNQLCFSWNFVHNFNTFIVSKTVTIPCPFIRWTCPAVSTQLVPQDIMDLLFPWLSKSLADPADERHHKIRRRRRDQSSYFVRRWQNPTVLGWTIYIIFSWKFHESRGWDHRLTSFVLAHHFDLGKERVPSLVFRNIIDYWAASANHKWLNNCSQTNGMYPIMLVDLSSQPSGFA